MIAAWMLYVVAVSAVLVSAAAVLERVVRGAGGQARWAWIGALAGAAALAGLALLDGTGPVVGPVDARAVGVLALPELVVGADSGLRSLDGPLLAGWALFSAFLALLWAGDAVRVGLNRRNWRTEWFGGVPTLRAEVGPAVVGVVRPRIVLPPWFGGLDGRLQELALIHEQEHVRARDPLLLATGYAVVLLMPWNPAAWWAFQRLRLAVEIDCDRRVLGRRPGEARHYGGLLLDVVARAVSPQPLSLGLFGSTSVIELRIRDLVASARRASPVRLVAFGTVGVALAGLAWLVPGPTASGGAAPPVVDVNPTVEIPAPDAPFGLEEIAREPTFTPFTVAPDIANRTEVVAALQAEYPPLLRDAGIGGTVQVWFFIDDQGRVRDTRVNQSSGHEALDLAAIEVANRFRFTPARGADGPVPVWVSLPITFAP